ncbi:MAG TPA: hypothetical protein VNL98_03690 [Gemmatimonadales bacterium]|nr:hypothetical protein [Gemmatimonadales bacterium]
MTHAGPSIRYRLATEIFPGLLDQAALDSLREQIESSPAVRAIVKKQKDTGAWGGNLLGTSPSKTAGVKDVGTIPQYRRLVELAVSRDSRSLKLASRLLFRLVSRDEDPSLLFEFARYDDHEPGTEPWVRIMLREAATAALAHGGYGEDPRIRGAAHKILNEVSAFIRGELAANPFVRSGKSWALNPLAYPPSVFSVSLLAYLPAVQRERAGLVERLGQYLTTPASKKAFVVQAGKKSLKVTSFVLGEPIHVTASGQCDDLPFALYWMEILARLGLLSASQAAAKVWARLVKDCDRDGVWHPKGLRGLPRSPSPWAYHMFPLDGDSKKPESRQTDVTFRMALIARLAGWELTQT